MTISYAATIDLDLDPWRPGLVVVQDKHDPHEFSALLRAQNVSEENLAIYRSEYEKLPKAGGFCYVRDTKLPWLIVVFGIDTAAVLKTFVHEAVHLGEHLPDRHNVPLTFATQEVRAQLAARAFEIFYPLHMRMSSALWFDRAIWIAAGALAASLYWAALKYLPSRGG